MSTPDHRKAPDSSCFVATRRWRGRNAFLLHEFVVMPNHLHLPLTPDQTTGLEKAVQPIQGRSSYQIRKQRGHKMEIWQQGFHDWAIRDSNDWHLKAEYIGMNPVGAQLAEEAEDRAFSSATGKFTLDPVSEKYLQLASAASSGSGAVETSGLKSRPPKESPWPNESQSPKGFHS